MMRIRDQLAALCAPLCCDQRGTMVIETAIVAPVLVLMSLGAYDVSRLLAKQSELDAIAEQGAGIALASKPDTSAKRTTLRQILVASSGLSASNVTVTEAYRCNSATAYVDSSSSCTTGVVSNFVKISLTATLTPTWTQFGVGSAITYQVDRYAMYSQTDVP